jgi:hypothetical protein
MATTAAKPAKPNHIHFINSLSSSFKNKLPSINAIGPDNKPFSSQLIFVSAVIQSLLL